MNPPVISVITPSYNQGSFIEETILSVISQEGEFLVDYLIIDGGSTDQSVGVIKRYAELISDGTFRCRCAGVSLRWVSERDAGQTDAINKGLIRSRGEILTYINSDDLFSPRAFAKVVAYLDTHPECDLVYGDGDVIDETGVTSWEWLSRPYDQTVMTSYHFLWNDFTNYIMQQSTFWRRRVVERIGHFDETFHYAMDAEYWIRAADAGLNLHHIPEKLGRFRLIQGTKSLSGPTVFWEDYLEIFRKYRRKGSLTTYLAFFYFNVAINSGGNVQAAFAQDQVLEKRWAALPRQERRSLMRQADRAKYLCRLILADELRKRGDRRASALIFEALTGRPAVLFHPFGAFYVSKCLLSGIVGKNRVDAGLAMLISWYRKKTIDYRYHTK